MTYRLFYPITKWTYNNYMLYKYIVMPYTVVKSGDRWKIKGPKGEMKTKFKTKENAEKRIKIIENFVKKHKKSN